MLHTKHLSLSYNKKVILKNITLSIPNNTITCIIGPSGAGKTSLLHVLAGIQSADSGQIHIDNSSYRFPLKTPLSYTKKHHMLMLFQQLFLWPHRTLWENIALPMKERFGVVDEEAIKDMATTLCIQNYLHHYPNESSLGQRQRAAFARAVLIKPNYLFLDEITSALDIEQMANLISLIKTLRDNGMSIVLVTHAINLARKLADQIVFLDKGVLVENGSTDILNNPKTERLKEFLQYT